MASFSPKGGDDGIGTVTACTGPWAPDARAPLTGHGRLAGIARARRQADSGGRWIAIAVQRQSWHWLPRRWSFPAASRRRDRLIALSKRPMLIRWLILRLCARLLPPDPEPSQQIARPCCRPRSAKCRVRATKLPTTAVRLVGVHRSFSSASRCVQSRETIATSLCLRLRSSGVQEFRQRRRLTSGIS
jgi:hypothetical protein